MVDYRIGTLKEGRDDAKKLMERFLKINRNLAEYYRGRFDALSFAILLYRDTEGVNHDT